MCYKMSRGHVSQTFTPPREEVDAAVSDYGSPVRLPSSQQTSNHDTPNRSPHRLGHVHAIVAAQPRAT